MLRAHRCNLSIAPPLPLCQSERVRHLPAWPRPMQHAATPSLPSSSQAVCRMLLPMQLALPGARRVSLSEAQWNRAQPS